MLVLVSELVAWTCVHEFAAVAAFFAVVGLVGVDAAFVVVVVVVVVEYVVEHVVVVVVVVVVVEHVAVWEDAEISAEVEADDAM